MAEIVSYIDKMIDDRKTLSNHLSSLFYNQKEEVSTRLLEAAIYASFPTGKLLRPLLTLASGEVFHAPFSSLLSPACAIEIIHVYSLIHDDLPCMDDDDFRRGKPSLHKAYSEGHAVLTGDFLLTYAFEILSTAPHLSNDQKVKLIQTLSICAGREGMIGGQALDIALTGEKISWDILEKIHLGKTAALLKASLEFGAIIGNASDEHIHTLRNIAHLAGLAFQILDDLLDKEGSISSLGKPAGSDEKNQKLTACALLGKQEAKRKVIVLKEAIAKDLQKLPEASYLEYVLHTMLEERS